MGLPPLPLTLQGQVDSPSELKDNTTPHFISLYRHLTSAVLDPRDASTKTSERADEETEVSRQLWELWLKEARQGSIIRALQELCVSNDSTDKMSGLSNDLKELCYVIAAYLSRYLTTTGDKMDDMDDLMTNEFEQFTDSLPQISRALSVYVEEIESTICKIVNAPNASPTFENENNNLKQKSKIPSTSSTTNTKSTRNYQPVATTYPSSSSSSVVQSSLAHQAHLTNTLSTLLKPITANLHTLLTLQTDLLQTQIRHLETHTHSTLTRHLTTHATFLSTVSQGISLKATIMTLLREKEIYAGEGIQDALREKWDEVTREEVELEQREEGLRLLLAEYEAVDGGVAVMKELGRGYKAVEEEIEVVRGDVEKMEGRVKGLTSRRDG